VQYSSTAGGDLLCHEAEASSADCLIGAKLQRDHVGHGEERGRGQRRPTPAPQDRGVRVICVRYFVNYKKDINHIIDIVKLDYCTFTIRLNGYTVLVSMVNYAKWAVLRIRNDFLLDP
jgi:hypothetical protein